MTKIILVRHGHVDGIMPHRFRGRVDLQLTSIGQEQARRTAMRIESAWRPARIYSSPMSRSIATGRAIGARFSLNVETDAGLNDLDFGNWQGLTPVEARSRWPNEFDTWFRAPHLANIPEGESLQTVLARVTATLRTILSRHPNDVVEQICVRLREENENEYLGKNQRRGAKIYAFQR